MSMFNYEIGLYCDCYIFKDKEGDIGEIIAWGDGDIGIYTNEDGLLLSHEQAKELASKLMELTKRANKVK